MSNRVKYFLIIACGIFLSAIFIYKNSFAPTTNCERSQDFIKDSYSGLVLNKILDEKNDNSITLTIKKNGKPWNLTVPKDTTLFSFIKIGDSLVKSKNEDFIEIHRSSITTHYKINFDCDTEKKP